MELRAVYKECLAEMMKEDKHVVVFDADLAKGNGTLPLQKEFPDQAFEAGIAEQNMASIAAGMASYGFKPYINTFTPFATRRMCDQIAISVAYAKTNVKIVGTDPGIAAELNGGTHMSMEDIGVLRSIPDIVIYEPVDPVQFRAALPVINDYEGCMYIRMFRKETPDVFEEGYEFDLFKADKLRDGSDLSIFVSGMFTRDVVDIADELASEGISCDVLNVHTIKPIDVESVTESARKTGTVLTVENHNVIGGLHSAVCEALAKERIPVSAVGVQDRFGEVGKTPYLREVMGLTKEDIKKAAKEAAALK